MLMRRSLEFLFMMAVLAMPVRAQTQLRDLPVGARVRVTSRSAGLRNADATVVSTTRDSIALALTHWRMERGATVRDSAIASLALADVDRLEAYSRGGLSTSGALIGGSVGGLFGVGGGGATMLVSGAVGATFGAGGRRALKGGAIGALIVGLPMGVLAAATFDNSSGCGFVGPCDAGQAFLWGVVGGGALGFMIGGVVGTLSRGEWRHVSLRGNERAVMPSVVGGRPGIAVSVTF
jgi:hypothetical protein